MYRFIFQNATEINNRVNTNFKIGKSHLLMSTYIKMATASLKKLFRKWPIAIEKF